MQDVDASEALYIQHELSSDNFQVRYFELESKLLTYAKSIQELNTPTKNRSFRNMVKSQISA